MHRRLFRVYIEERRSLLKASMIFYIPGVSARLQGLGGEDPRATKNLLNLCFTAIIVFH
jgi:hypothetical protein